LSRLLAFSPNLQFWHLFLLISLLGDKIPLFGIEASVKPELRQQRRQLQRDVRSRPSAPAFASAYPTAHACSWQMRFGVLCTICLAPYIQRQNALARCIPNQQGTARAYFVPSGSCWTCWISIPQSTASNCPLNRVCCLLSRPQIDSKVCSKISLQLCRPPRGTSISGVTGRAVPKTRRILAPSLE